MHASKQAEGVKLDKAGQDKVQYTRMQQAQQEKIKTTSKREKEEMVMKEAEQEKTSSPITVVHEYLELEMKLIEVEEDTL